MRTTIFVCLLLVALPIVVLAQSEYRAGSLSQMNVNFKVLKNWKLNTKLETRQIFSEREPDTQASHRFRYERTDLSTVLTTKLSADNTVGGGYLVRLEDKKFTHRLIQQFNHVKKLDFLSLAHRVVADETFTSGEPAEIRLRYRLGLEKPLNGLQIDPKEFYAKVNNEYLGIWSARQADLEIRGLLALGYNATDDNKVELGLEYRVSGFSDKVNAHQFWLSVGWFLSI